MDNSFFKRSNEQTLGIYLRETRKERKRKNPKSITQVQESTVMLCANIKTLRMVLHHHK